jgi:hypothetical protein
MDPVWEPDVPFLRISLIEWSGSSGTFSKRVSDADSCSLMNNRTPRRVPTLVLDSDT